MAVSWENEQIHLAGTEDLHKRVREKGFICYSLH